MSGATTYGLYVAFALGAVAVYALLPRRHSAPRCFGVAVGLAALAALIAVLAWRATVPDATSAYFYLFAVLAIVSAARVVTHTKPVYSALYFVLTVVSVACLLVLLHAEFLAVATVIIYAGAILVTYLFVIMLAQQSGAPAYDRNAREPLAAVLGGFVLMAAIAGRASEIPLAPKSTATLAASPAGTQVSPAAEGNTAAIGWTLLTRHVVATELAAVLLLISMIGAIALSKKRVPTDEHLQLEPRIGQAGREVEPF